MARICCAGVFDIALYLFIAFVPISITVSQAALSVALIIWLAKSIYSKTMPIKNRLDLAVLVYILSLFVSIFITKNYSVSLKDLPSAFLPLCYFLVASVNVKKLKNIIWILFFATLISSLYGLFEKLQGQIRIGGFLGFCMTFSQVISLVLPIYICLAIARYQRKIWQYTVWIGTVIIFIALILTYTRSAWLGTIAATITSALVLKGRILLFTIFLYFLALILILAPWLKGRPITIGVDKGRLFFWEVGLRMFGENPILGVGRANPSYLFNEYTTDALFDKYLPESKDLIKKGIAHLHSNYIQTLAEGGTVGFLILMFLIYTILRYSWLAYKNCKGEYCYIALGIFCAVVSFIVSGFFECTLLDSEVTMLLFSLVGAVKVIFYTDQRC